MWWMCVVESWVLSFDAVECSIEGRDLDADFGDEIAGYVGGEGGGIVGLGPGEGVVVNELGKRWFVHVALISKEGHLDR